MVKTILTMQDVRKAIDDLYIGNQKEVIERNLHTAIQRYGENVVLDRINNDCVYFYTTLALLEDANSRLVMEQVHLELLFTGKRIK